jgi:hypothetical protein
MRLARQTLFVAFVAAFCNAGSAIAQLPPLQLVRPDENYSVLKDPEVRTGLEARVKYVPLGDEGVWLSLGGEVRERMDSISPGHFGIGQDYDAYILQRVLTHADLHFNDHVRVYAELSDHEVYGKHLTHAPTDSDGVDLQNAFVDLQPDSAERLRVGRQELMFSPQQRFVAVREGPNIRQSFDGLRATWSSAGSAWRIDAIAVRPLQLETGSFDDRTDSGQCFWGAYVSRTMTAAGHSWTLDGYGFELDRDAVSYGGVVGDEHRQSFGARLASGLGRWDLDWEVMLQSGAFAGQHIRAWAAGLDTGYALDVPWKPRLGFRLDVASGDRNSNDGRLETFNPLFPKGAYFNESALTSWVNLTAPRFSLRVQPRGDLTFEASVTGRWRTSVYDGVYLQPATLLPQTLRNTNRWVGAAYALDGSWKATRNIAVSAELVRQATGGAITDSGGRDSNFAMLVLQFRF